MSTGLPPSPTFRSIISGIAAFIFEPVVGAMDPALAQQSHRRLRRQVARPGAVGERLVSADRHAGVFRSEIRRVRAARAAAARPAPRG